MTYRPLPDNLTIKNSKIEGLGLFATKDIKKDHIFGITHVKDDRFEKRNRKLSNLLNIELHTPDEYKDFLSEAGYQIEIINNLSEKNWITVVAQEAKSNKDN